VHDDRAADEKMKTTPPTLCSHCGKQITMSKIHGPFGEVLSYGKCECPQPVQPDGTMPVGPPASLMVTELIFAIVRSLLRR
jgi:hypothetical protein